MVNEDEAKMLFKPVTSEEIKYVLENFKKERSPGPDGWTTEFFIFFFDLVGEYFLDMVEDSRRKGHLSGGINATFLALIPKANKSVSFDDYRPISLCRRSVCGWKMQATYLSGTSPSGQAAIGCVGDFLPFRQS